MLLDEQIPLKANQTYDLPLNLGDLMGAYDEAHWQTQVCEIKAGIGVLVPLSAGTEAQAYGVLLDPSIDTAAPYSDGSVTGSVAKAGNFRGPTLIVPAGVDAGLNSVALRGRGIFVEGPITVPAAAAASASE